MSKPSSIKLEDASASQPLKPVQFSIASILGAMVIVGATLAVLRISILAGCAFAAIVLPALMRTLWAEVLRRRAGIGGAPGDAVGTYFVSLAIMALIGALSLAISSGVFVTSAILLLWDDPVDGPIVPAAFMGMVAFICLFWLTRPRLRHYLP